MNTCYIHLVFKILGPTVGIVISITIPCSLVLIDRICEMVGIQQCLLLGERADGLALFAIDIMQISSVLSIRETLILNEFAIPKRVEIGILAKPFEFDLVATLVIQMRSVHWAETVGIEVDVEDQGIAIGVVGGDISLETVEGSPEVTTLLRIMRERSYHSRIRHTTIEVLVVAGEAGRIDGVALDFVWPRREVDHALGAKDLVDVLAGFGSEIIVGHLGYDTVAFWAPCKEIASKRYKKEKNSGAFHCFLTYFVRLSR